MGYLSHTESGNHGKKYSTSKSSKDTNSYALGSTTLAGEGSVTRKSPKSQKYISLKSLTFPLAVDLSVPFRGGFKRGFGGVMGGSIVTLIFHFSLFTLHFHGLDYSKP